MRQKPETAKPTAEAVVKDIRHRTRKHHSAEAETTFSAALETERMAAQLTKISLRQSPRGSNC